MATTRRELFQGAAVALAAPAVSVAEPSARRIRLAVSTYSYWHFKGDRYPIEKVIDKAADIGFEGVELLHRQMTDDSAPYLTRLKRAAMRNGMAMPMLSMHQDFVSPDPEERRRHVEHTKYCIDMASYLGIPVVRLNSGRWKTVASFDDLMKVKGDEPPLPGYTNDDAFHWCVESIEQCLPWAEKAGVTLALENHWGLTTRVEMLLRIYNAVKSPWLGINLDTGNFPVEPYPEIEKLIPFATIVQAKTYYGGGVWYTLDLDYKRIAGIFRKAGYTGWVSLEMEGNENADTAVPKSYAMLREAFA
ncbi:MAG: sugar phosphate isomerase/epimerase family protein [Bryobacteraceae bacterium]